MSSEKVRKVLFFVFLTFTFNNLFAGEKVSKDKGLPSVIVFDIKPEKGVDVGSANLLTELVLNKVTELLKGKYKVLGQRNIDKMLFWETNKSLKNCSESSCMTQIAGALGADYYIEGSLGVIGKKLATIFDFNGER